MFLLQRDLEHLSRPAFSPSSSSSLSLSSSSRHTSHLLVDPSLSMCLSIRVFCYVLVEEEDGSRTPSHPVFPVNLIKWRGWSRCLHLHADSCLLSPPNLLLSPLPSSSSCYPSLHHATYGHSVWGLERRNDGLGSTAARKSDRRSGTTFPLPRPSISSFHSLLMMMTMAEGTHMGCGAISEGLGRGSGE